MLSPYKVLDLSDEKGMLCGKLLSDMGAEVIKIEKPGGDRARLRGPFIDNKPEPEKSLFWFAFNLGKKGITLDIEKEKGKELFRELAIKSDFVIESFNPGFLDRIGIGYEQLRQINPRVILVSITPFGQTGPYRNFKGDDLICSAMSGLVYMNGDADRPPIAFSLPQAEGQASAHAAAAALVAHYYRQHTGKGQHIDVSMQQSMLRTLHLEPTTWEYMNKVVHRSGSKRIRGAIVQEEVWPCKDGYVVWRFLGGASGGKHIRSLTSMMDRAGMAGSLKEASLHWDSSDLSTMKQEDVELWEEDIASFLKTMTKQEIYHDAVQAGTPITPANTIEDMVNDEQLSSRGFWIQVEHPELGRKIMYAGPWFYSNEFQFYPRRRAPLIGEHNNEIYGDWLKLHQQQINKLKESGVI